jgi:hypothetical protein
MDTDATPDGFNEMLHEPNTAVALRSLVRISQIVISQEWLSGRAALSSVNSEPFGQAAERSIARIGAVYRGGFQIPAPIEKIIFRSR